ASPTITTPAMTAAGIILGTAAYMSPEQAKGKPADKRSDIWAFGCVLYEMLTGKRAFEAEDVAETLAAVLRGAPDWQALPADLPRTVSALLEQCLRKDRHQRIGDVAAARFALNDSNISAASPVAIPSQVPLSRRAIPVAAIGVVCAAIAGGAVWNATRSVAVASRPVVRFTIPLDGTQHFTGVDRRMVAISPDGTRLVFVANNRLYIRQFDELDAAAIRGTESGPDGLGPDSPVFSADGQSVAFWQGGQIRRVPVGGGTPLVLCTIRQNSGGMNWAADDTLVFSQGPLGIWRVSGGGGTPELITRPPTEGQGALHPQILPGNRAVLYTLRTLTDATTDQIVVQSIDGGTPRV